LIVIDYYQNLFIKGYKKTILEIMSSEENSIRVGEAIMTIRKNNPPDDDWYWSNLFDFDIDNRVEQLNYSKLVDIVDEFIEESQENLPIYRWGF
jgi:hypothetical protein